MGAESNRFTRVTSLAALLVAACCAFSTEAHAGPVEYSIVAVKAPRYGDDKLTYWQEVISPARVEPGQDLVLINPDGSEETLVNCSNLNSSDHFNNHFPKHAGKKCSVIDPCMSLDGKSVYFSLLPQGDRKQFVGNELPDEGADIYRLNLQTKAVTQLTNQEFTPNTATPFWGNTPHYNDPEPGKAKVGGVFNVGACPVAGPTPGSERIVFTSSRDIHTATRGNGSTNPNMKLYLMDSTGKNVRPIGHMNLGSAMHPVPLKDGRIAFSTLESQGTHTAINWGLWAMLPDGRTWEPLFSALTWGVSTHWHGQASDGSLFSTLYYNQNNNGFGTLVAFPNRGAPGQAGFGNPTPQHPTNALLQEGWFGPNFPRYIQYSFSPIGVRTLTAFSRSDDWGAPRDPVTNEFLGKVTHPTGAPGNDVLLVYSKGPANSLNRPTQFPAYLGGIYLLKNMQAIVDPKNLVKVKEDPAYNYQQPHPAVSYKDIHGVDAPAYVPYLPEGETPFGLLGTASFYNRNTGPGVGEPSYNGLDAFNDDEHTTNWESQGADAGLYASSDIYAVRILAMEPLNNIRNGYSWFSSIPKERLRILGEIPLRKPDEAGNQPLDGDGNPDTSFLAKIPADVPFTFQTIDKRGMVLNASQTWHQLRPGEIRTDCGGCHAHANRPTDFTQTAAAKPGYATWDLVDRQPLLTRPANETTVTTFTGAERLKRMNVEYVRDIKPIFERSCNGCHSKNNPGGAAGKLDLADKSLNWMGLEKSYRCLVLDLGEDQCGGYGFIRGRRAASNASRWVRKLQSRRSLLVWKVFGERLDGWKNEDHPTETVLGDLSTFPAGQNIKLADIDYVGTMMPPPGSGYQPLTEDEKMMVARWIDLGAPSNAQGEHNDTILKMLTVFADDLRPTLNIAWPRPERNGALRRLSFAAYDYESGLNLSSFSVFADFPVNGMAPGTNLASMFAMSGNVWSLPLAEQITNLPLGKITVEVADNEGNKTKQETIFSVGSQGGVPQPDPTPFAPLPTPVPGIPTPGGPGAPGSPTPPGGDTPGRGPRDPGNPSAPGENAAPWLGMKAGKNFLTIKMKDDGLPAIGRQAESAKKKKPKPPRATASTVSMKVYLSTPAGKKLIAKWRVTAAKSKMYKKTIMIGALKLTPQIAASGAQIIVESTDGELSSSLVRAMKKSWGR